MHSRTKGAPTHPTRRLLITWAVLMGLTLITMASAQLGGEARLQALPLWSAGLLLATTFFKAHRVLMVYLGLTPRRRPGAAPLPASPSSPCCWWAPATW